MDSIDELLASKRIRPGTFGSSQVEECLVLAERDLVAARGILPTSPEWAYNIAYNAMLQAGRALMFRRGYRTAGEGHHATVVEFLSAVLGDTLGDMVDLMDRMRRNRNRATYGAAGTIHTKQAQDACAIADRFVEALAAIARS